MVIVFTIVGIFIGFGIGIFWTCTQCGKDYRISSLSSSEADMLKYWIQRNRNEKRDMSLFFLNNNYDNVVVYGACGKYYDCFMGDILTKRVRNLYLADKRAEELSEKTGQKVYAKEELRLLKPDAIVITSDLHYEEIKKELDALQLDTDIYSYRDLVYNLRKEQLQ